jgi:hypothetical protein
MHEGGWLNNLLNLKTEEKIKAHAKTFKFRKNQNKNEVMTSVEAADEWGSPVIGKGENPTNQVDPTGSSSPKIGTNSGDDWGSPSPLNDWDNPGTSNNSGSKEEW